MKAVILVGGEGTRMRPLTCNTPKPMLPLANRPFLEHVVRYLKSYGIDEIILSMCYRPDVIHDHFGDGSAFSVRLNYAVEDSPLGTAGGVKNVAQHLDAPFFVFNGDILTDLDLGAMLQFHRERRAKATISLTPVEDPTAYGLVETDQGGAVQQFIEKPSWDRVTTNLINAGTYILEPDLLDLIPAHTFYMFERGLFPHLLQRGDPIYGFPSDAYWLDIGTPAKYLQAHCDVLTNRISSAFPGVEALPGIWISDECRVDKSAKLTPPIVLGKGVTINKNALLEGPLVIGDHCVIGAQAHISESVVWSNTSVGERSTVKSSLVGRGCRLSEDVALHMGAVVGDECEIGPGNRLERGIRIWPARRIEAQTITF